MSRDKFSYSDKKKNLITLDIVYDFIRNKQYHKALAEINKVRDCDRDNDWLKTKGRILKELKRYQEAIDTLIQIPSQDRGFEENLSIGFCYKNLKRFNQAIQLLNELFQKESNRSSKTLIMTLSFCYQSINDDMAAISVVETYPYLSRDKTLLIMYSSLCNKYNEIALIKKTLKYLYAYRYWNEDHDIIYSIALCHSKEGDYKKAIDILESFTSKRNENTKILLFLGYCYQEEKQFQSAIRVYEKILEKEPNEKATNCLRACYFSLKEKQEHLTLQDKEEILQILPPNIYQDSNVLISYARLCHKMNQPEMALKQLYAFPGWENDVNIIATIVVSYLKKGEPEKSLSYMINYIPKDQQNVTISLLLARCYEEASQFDLAANTYKAILKQEYNENAAIALGACYQALGDTFFTNEFYQDLRAKSKSKLSILACAEYHFKQGNFSKALEEFNYILEHWGADPAALLKKGRCQMNMHHYEEALNTFQSIQEDSVDKKIYLIECHQQMGGKTKLLEDNLEQAYNLSPNKKTAKSLVLFYKRREDHEKALHYLSFSEWKDDPDFILEIAHCYQGMGDHQKAISILNQLKESSTNIIYLNEISLKLGLCYENIGCYEKAIQAYKIKNWNNNKKALFRLSTCYSKAGNFPEAQVLSERLYSYEKDTGVISTYANIHEHAKNYEEAIKLFDLLKDDPSAVSGTARCYRLMGKLDEAIDTIKRYTQWNKSPELVLSMAYLYRKKGLTIESRTIIEHIPEWKYRVEMLLFYVESFSIAEPEKIKYLQLAIQNFPASPLVAYRYCEFLMHTDPQKAKEQIAIYLKKYPNLIELEHFNACLKANGNPETEFYFLKALEKKFPYSIDNYLRLIQAALALNKDKEFERLANLCYHKFQGNYTLFNQIKQLTDGKNLLLTWGSLPFPKKLDLVTNTQLSKSIEFLFEKIADLPGEQYLVGGAQLALLQQKELAPGQDIDLVILSEGKIDLTVKGFKPCPESKFFYQMTTEEGTLVDCLVINPDTYGVLDRDFTVSAVFSDRKGNVYDPSGLGLEDIENKCLRTIQDPVVYFQEDPVCLLRAIRLMTDGYVPTPKVEEALRNYRYDGELNARPLVTLMTKHLRRLDKTHQTVYFKLLTRYGLTKKLFNFEQDSTIEIKKILDSLEIQNQGTMPCPKEPTVLKTTLTETSLAKSVKELFEKLKHVPGKHYLVGSAALAFLENKELNAQQDIDLVIFSKEKIELTRHGFTACPYNHSLYQTTIKGGISVDCLVVDAADLGVSGRDFTVGAIFVDKIGRTYDPSRVGLKDMRDKCLRTIENPTLCFQEDPTRLLRAIKLLVDGYKATPRVEKAMQNWRRSERLDFSHLKQIVNKHMLHLDDNGRLLYMDFLEAYGLDRKLFNFEKGKTATVEQFLKHLRTQSIDSIFDHETPNIRQNYSQPVPYPTYFDHNNASRERGPSNHERRSERTTTFSNRFSDVSQNAHDAPRYIAASTKQVDRYCTLERHRSPLDRNYPNHRNNRTLDTYRTPERDRRAQERDLLSRKRKGETAHYPEEDNRRQQYRFFRGEQGENPSTYAPYRRENEYK